jgi:hypothetical protein
MTEAWREKPAPKIEKYITDLANEWDISNESTSIKLTEFIKYVPKHSLMQFISRYELYKLIEDVPGDIIELGVCGGRGLFSFVQSVFINEPQYEWRNIVGFDTFEGFVSVHEKDNIELDSELKKSGAFKNDSYEQLHRLKNIHEDFRFMTSREQIELVKGDVMKTIPEYLEKNKGLIVSLLYLDMDLYEPTKFALEKLWERIPKGGVVVFDEAIMRDWPGEACALHETLGIGSYKLKKIPYIKQFYLVKE